MVNDSISDLLTRIRNASMVQHSSVNVPYSRINLQICEILEKEGYIHSFQLSSNTNLTTTNDASTIIIRLKYRYSKTLRAKVKQSCITNLRRISKPGLRIYTNYKEIPRILGGTGIVILSTPEGLMTDREARLAKVGGELLCSVW
jgi:small subunit ribosomal protein S8